MKMVNILSRVLILILFLTIQVSSFNDKRSSYKFVKHLSGSKRGDTMEVLEQASKYLFKYGYLDPSMYGRYQKSLDKFNDSNVFDHALRKGIKKFQLFFNISNSGILDEETLSIMERPRCNFPDLVNGSPIKHGVKLVRVPFIRSYFTFLGPKWSKFNLSWFKASRTRRNAIQPLTSAFQTWADVTNFTFTRIDLYSDSDVKINFGDAEQGNVYLFRSTQLAYTYLPPEAEVFFNVEIPWVIGNSRDGHDIETTAVHEIGHILGLGHTSDVNAVMYPTKDKGMVKRVLHPDDIAGIQALYP